MTIRAPAKINLHLRILRKRPDGYHDIETIFERIALFDRITLRSSKNGKIRIFCDNPAVPKGKTGLAYRAAALLRKEFRIKDGIDVRIVKKIPVAAGLGGGSSDAAGILTGLNKIWRLSLNAARLSEFGKKLGADVSFFLKDCSFAAGTERGDAITPLRCRKKFWHLLISPPVRLLSKDMYGAYKKKSCPSSFFSNDLEQIVLKKAPLVARIKRALKKVGLTYSLVSGSGPSVFSLFESRKEAVRARELLLRRFPFVKNRGWQIFIVPTM